MRCLLYVAAASAMFAGPAYAQDSQSGPATGVKNPNQVVCKTRPSVGSRLGGAKTCRTRQEWADMRQQTRETLEKTQQLWQKN